VVFHGEGDTDQAGIGRGQQQRADRTVDGAIGDVEDAVGRGRGRQLMMQPGQVVVVHAVGASELVGQRIWDVHR
jgi:hypothetical protein